MKVKVGATTYDAEIEPVMVILTDRDKALIAAMAPEAHRYCAYPEGMDPGTIRRWMNDDVKPTGEPEGTPCQP
jgi:hypothetical protein